MALHAQKAHALHGHILVSEGNARVNTAPCAVRVIGYTRARVIVERVPLLHRVEFPEQSSETIDTFSINMAELEARPLLAGVPLTSRAPNKLLRFVEPDVRRGLAARGATAESPTLMYGSGAKAVYFYSCPEPSMWSVRVVSR